MLQMLSPVSFADVNSWRSASTAQDNLTRVAPTLAALAAVPSPGLSASANEEWTKQQQPLTEFGVKHFQEMHSKSLVLAFVFLSTVERRTNCAHPSK